MLALVKDGVVHFIPLQAVHLNRCNHKNRTSNIQTANSDVAHSKDSRLLELVNAKSAKVPTGIKR